MRWLLPFLLCTSCKWVYDAQYDDRADELEAFRSEFLPASDQVQFLTGTDHHVWWVSLVKPLDETMLHSFAPATGQRVDFEQTRGLSNIEQNFRMSDELLVRCSFGTSIMYDGSQSNVMLDMTDQGSDSCGVDKTTVYFAVNRKIMRWTRGAALVQVADLDAQSIGTDTIGGMGVSGNRLLLEEGGRLWSIDLGTGVATWLENPNVTSGEIAFDANGAMFPTQAGVQRELFADHSTQLLQDLIADGGYDLNFEHSDIQDLGDFAEYSLTGSSVVYRGKSGIFGYRFDSKKVIDLLLDRGQDLTTSPVYRTPVVADGAVFVQDQAFASTGHPVYRVDLNGRLP